MHYLEFHDSRIVSVEEGESLVITFAVGWLHPAELFHREDYVPLEIKRPVRLILPGGKVKGDWPDFDDNPMLWDGKFRFADSKERHITVPSELVGEVAIELTFSSGEELVIQADGLKAEIIDEG